jgi:hypothetical protein
MTTATILALAIAGAAMLVAALALLIAAVQIHHGRSR